MCHVANASHVPKTIASSLVRTKQSARVAWWSQHVLPTRCLLTSTQPPSSRHQCGRAHLWSRGSKTKPPALANNEEIEPSRSPSTPATDGWQRCVIQSTTILQRDLTSRAATPLNERRHRAPPRLIRKPFGFRENGGNTGTPRICGASTAM